MHRMTTSSFTHIMNVSLSQTLSRTIVTSSVTMLSMLAFFFVGTPVIKDLSLTLFIGFIAGTYSTVYIASPITEWMDKRFFRRA
jgi:preprotein translocase subunit SecF